MSETTKIRPIRHRDTYGSTRHEIAPRTIGIEQMQKEACCSIQEEPSPEDRPRCRAECENSQRPCPWVSCKYHLYLDVMPSGSIRFNFPGKDVWELRETCALDVADRGKQHSDEIARLINLTSSNCRETLTLYKRRLAQKIGDKDKWL